jgi:hypothetical protein
MSAAKPHTRRSEAAPAAVDQTPIVSPYAELPPSEWMEVTRRLVADHPLRDEFVDVVLEAWNDIFATRIGAKGYQIGTHVKLSPQLMGAFLHELIPLIFQDRHHGEWRRESRKGEKDLVCVPNAAKSVEIKTSSHDSQIFGNRSYGQPLTSAADVGKKGKSGYYLAINFEKFATKQPTIVQVRFGWLDHSDWVPQKAETGQAARVTAEAYAGKLISLYPRKIIPRARS